ncbi:MAG: hypothetical protein IPL52_03390 [Flavobacteriales bacterium]|nr:hypothetical protein [Flavobacteriales bacterium]
MLHQIALFLNVIGVLFVDAFLVANLNITQNIPTTLAPGSETRVVVEVEKGTLTGFAKLQIDLPPGLSATAIETKGASFTFADGKAKFIWMALPSSPSFKVSYTLTADASISGVQHINGRLSYIEDNERKTHDMSTSVVDFGAPGAVPVAQSEAAVPEEEVNNDLVSAAGGAPAGAIAIAVIDDAPGTAPMQGAGGVGGSRIITPVSEKEMLVEVLVRKGDIRGFGKLQEVIPQGFTALEKSSSEAIFTVQDRIVKFVWLNLPATNEIRVVYKLRANERPDGEYTIDGEFGYLLNDETQKAVLGSSKFFVGARALEAIANDPSGMGNMSGSDPELALRQRQEAERKAAEEVAAQKRAREEAEARAQRNAQNTTANRIPAPERGVTYKVQITAAHREVGKSYFRARHNYGGDFQIERHEGWIKYVTGGYADYKSARDQRVGYVQSGHNFPGPFVTAYNDGRRITVQEALVISKQQWVQ